MEEAENPARSSTALPENETAKTPGWPKEPAAPVRAYVTRGKKTDANRIGLTESRSTTLAILIFLYFFTMAVAHGQVAYLSLFWWGILPYLILAALYYSFGGDKSVESGTPLGRETTASLLNAFQREWPHPESWGSLPGIAGWLTSQRLYLRSGRRYPLRFFEWYETRPSRIEGWLVVVLHRSFWRRCKMTIVFLTAVCVLSLGSWAQLIASLALVGYAGPRFDLLAVVTAAIAMLVSAGCAGALLLGSSRSTAIQTVEVCIPKDSADLERARGWLRDAGLPERRRKSKAR